MRPTGFGPPDKMILLDGKSEYISYPQGNSVGREYAKKKVFKAIIN